MSREIKFRIFNLRTYEFEYFTIEQILTEKYSLYNSIQKYDKRISQYTGLKDKNENEIYEGDILKDETTYPLEVYWNNEKASFFLKWIDNNINEKSPIITDDDSFEYLEVIGNIYEHTDLLEKK